MDVMGMLVVPLTITDVTDTLMGMLVRTDVTDTLMEALVRTDVKNLLMQSPIPFDVMESLNPPQLDILARKSSLMLDERYQDQFAFYKAHEFERQPEDAQGSLVPNL